MKSYNIGLHLLGVVFLLGVVELEASSVSQLSCQIRDLTVTADDYLRIYVDGVEITGLPNAGIYYQTDVVDLPCTTKLIAIHGQNGPGGPGGILASTADEYVLTNSSWKCSNVIHSGWEEINFDDSQWAAALEFYHDGYIPGFSPNAFWIWLRQYTSDDEEMDMDVYCRRRLDPNICAISSPCLFGATCIDEPNGEYRCVCVPGYTGRDCSSVINYCESDPCVSGGSCESIVNGYACHCLPGYTGDNCEYVINHCASFPCLSGGTCLSGIGYFICVCPPEWTGDRCEIAFDACDSNPCLNGGTCNYHGGDSYTCTCPIYVTGVKCESPNYNEAYACGTTLAWSQYNASNGFTRLCYFWTQLDDIEGRFNPCRNTIKGIPLYDDYIGLLNAGGNFGCLVSQDYPDDLPATSVISCSDNYQHDVYIGNNTETDRLMVCIRYPYEGVPDKK